MYTGEEIDKLIDQGLLAMDDDFQIDDDFFLVLEDSCYHINHSCDPNTGIKEKNTLIAIKNIKKGKEITYDYSTVTGYTKNKLKYANDKWTMNCNCGAKNCRKIISHIGTVPKNKIDEYFALDALPDFIKTQVTLNL